jgi:hypothetical protein
LRDARLALICAYDLYLLAKLYHEIDISTGTVSEETMVNYLRASENEMGLCDSYVSIIEKAYVDYVKNQQESFADMTDDQIEQFAQTVLNEYQLPSQRLANIIKEAKSYRFFSHFGNTDDYEVLTDLGHYQSQSTLYANPSCFIIKNKQTGIESLPSLNLEKLANEFGALK